MGMGKIGEGNSEVYTSSYKINNHSVILYRVGNIITGTVMALYEDRWSIDLL